MNVPDNVTDGYKVFLKTEYGKYFVSIVEGIISTNHESAEENPELARDHTQRAKGAREVLDHLRSVVLDRRKPN